MSGILEFRGIYRSYERGANVLDGVTFSLAEGDIAGLVGRNGAGKTTLIRIAMGMLNPDKGDVRVFGVSPFKEPVTARKRIGYVSEDQMLPGASSVAELIAFHRYLFPQWDESLATHLLDRFSLSLKSKIRALSKGEARQVALLLAVCHRPQLLLLDEPAGGLDPAARREFLETSIQLLNREGTAILFSSHHLGDIERIGGRVVLLDAGRVLLDHDIDRIREDLCIAVVPCATVPDPDRLRRALGCLRVRRVFDDWHAVTAGTPETIASQFHEVFGTDGLRCNRVPLEDLFIELVGGERAESHQ